MPCRKPTVVRACLLLFGLLAVSRAQATTVADFSVDDLVRHSQVGVRARVVQAVEIDHEWTRYTLRVGEVLSGRLDTATFEIDLLRQIEGMPTLRSGDDLILFLNFDNRIEKVIGLRWGIQRVREGRVYSHDWESLRIHSATRDGLPETFLEPLPDERAESISYAEFRAQLIEVRNRLTSRENRGTGSGD